MSQVHGYLCAAWMDFSIQHIQPKHGIFIAILPIEKEQRRSSIILSAFAVRKNPHDETRSIKKSILHSQRAQTTLVPIQWPGIRNIEAVQVKSASEKKQRMLRKSSGHSLFIWFNLLERQDQASEPGLRVRVTKFSFVTTNI